MQPFWALSFPSLDALEESELRRAVAAKPRKTKPSGKQYPLVTRPKGKQASVTDDALPLSPNAYAELIAEHFARSIYIL